eukprot:scaffold366615_cov20-Prasinocladus_malaysianus.AAC.1
MVLAEDYSECQSKACAVIGHYSEQWPVRGKAGQFRREHTWGELGGGEGRPLALQQLALLQQDAAEDTKGADPTEKRGAGHICQF